MGSSGSSALSTTHAHATGPAGYFGCTGMLRSVGDSGALVAVKLSPSLTTPCAGT